VSSWLLLTCTCGYPASDGRRLLLAETVSPRLHQEAALRLQGLPAMTAFRRPMGSFGFDYRAA
jgi:hypothetical protein